MSNEEVNVIAACVSKLSSNGSERRLECKVAIITGGAMGIGEAIARLFTKHGAKVIIADLADEVGKKLAESLSLSATYAHCDVSKEEDVKAVVDLAMEKHGQLDIMYNNAGIIDALWFQRVEEYDMEQYDRVIVEIVISTQLETLPETGQQTRRRVLWSHFGKGNFCNFEPEKIWS